MFLTKRALKEKIARLEYRIADLEERLCPCSQHDMVVIGSKFIPNSYGDGEHLRTYKCKRCGKVIMKYDWED